MAPAAAPRRSALFFVFVLLLVHLPFAASGLSGRGAPSLLVPADALLLALLVSLVVWLRLPAPRIALGLIALFAATLLCFRAADSLVPLFFDRPFDLHRDWSYLPDLYALMRDTQSTFVFHAALVALAALIAGAVYGFYRAFAAMETGFRRPRCRAAVAVAAGALALAGLAAGGPVRSSSTLPRVAEELVKVARRPAYAKQQERYLAERGNQEVSAPLSGLAGRNVLLFIVESYGYTLFSETRHFEPIREDLLRIEAALQRAGYHVASSFLGSPAFGGNSWLADSTLASGVRVDNEQAYGLLLASDVKPIAGYFNEAGYRTVAAMPATTYAWPEGDYFRFQKQYHFGHLGYRGPSLKWAPMPDQYVLDAMHRREVAAASKPLFLQYVLVSSHYPFNLIPRYFEDWDQIGDGSIFGLEGSVQTVPIPAGSQTGGAEGYVAAMRYELGLISEYLRRFIRDETLAVIVGDHQPFTGITGKGKPWSVPVHVISRAAALLEPFLKRGYSPGLVPAQQPPHAGLESFLPGLLEDFSPAKPAAVRPREAGARPPRGAAPSG